MLTVTNCSVQFSTTAVDNVSFLVAKNTTTSLIGRSGSGKSTILRCIAGLQVYNGTIEIDKINQQNVPTHKRAIGWVDQERTLLPHLSIADNIGLPLKLRKEKKPAIAQKVNTIMADFGIAKLASRMPSEVSGGEQQRAAVARALIYTPPLLLLDEPFGALDAITRYELTKWLQTVLQRYTITTLLVTHDIREAKQLSQQAIVLEQGAIAAQGNWNQLQNSKDTTVQGLLHTMA